MSLTFGIDLGQKFEKLRVAGLSEYGATVTLSSDLRIICTIIRRRGGGVVVRRGGIAVVFFTLSADLRIIRTIIRRRGRGVVVRRGGIAVVNVQDFRKVKVREVVIFELLSKLIVFLVLEGLTSNLGISLLVVEGLRKLVVEAEGARSGGKSSQSERRVEVAAHLYF